MRFMKTVITIVFVTAAAVIYVHQQVELVKLSYDIESKERIVKDMLDRNGRLGYNIGNLEAPSRLEGALIARKIDVAFPKKGNVVTVARRSSGQRNEMVLRSSGIEKRALAVGLIDFFTQSREAQAREK
jgi:hypothetical protein